MQSSTKTPCISILESRQIPYIAFSRMQNVIETKIAAFRSERKQQLKALFDRYYLWLELYMNDDPELQPHPDDAYARVPRASSIFVSCIIIAVLSGLALYAKGEGLAVPTWCIVTGFAIAFAGCLMVKIPSYLKPAIDRFPDVSSEWSSLRLGQSRGADDLIREFSIPPRFHEKMREIADAIPNADFTLETVGVYSGRVAGTKIREILKIVYLNDMSDLGRNRDERRFVVCFW